VRACPTWSWCATCNIFLPACMQGRSEHYRCAVNLPLAKYTTTGPERQNGCSEVMPRSTHAQVGCNTDSTPLQPRAALSLKRTAPLLCAPGRVATPARRVPTFRKTSSSLSHATVSGGSGGGGGSAVEADAPRRLRQQQRGGGGSGGGGAQLAALAPVSRGLYTAAWRCGRPARCCPSLLAACRPRMSSRPRSINNTSWSDYGMQTTCNPLPFPAPPPPPPPVPCLSRAADLERYDPQSEFALAGDEDGWTATHRDPGTDAAAAGGGGGDDEGIPSLDEDAEAAAPAAAAGKAGAGTRVLAGARAAAAPPCCGGTAFKACSCPRGAA
jgi:hypothetical protein